MQAKSHKKTTTPKKLAVKAVKQQKRGLKTKKVVKVAPKSTLSLTQSTFSTPSFMSSPISIMNPSFTKMQPRRKFSTTPNNLKTHSELNNAEADRYNTMMPSTTITDQWEEQLDRVDADVDLEDADLSSDVEKYVEEHGETPNFWSSPAAVQYNIFNEDPQFEVAKRLIGPFGTIEEPTMVYSPKPYRIVGCVGSPENPHQLGWFAMEGYLKTMCPNCGQIFQLTNNPEEVDFRIANETLGGDVQKDEHFGLGDH